MTDKQVKEWASVLVVLTVVFWNLTILGVTAYVVFWMGHSGWWFLLAVFLLWTTKSSEDKD